MTSLMYGCSRVIPTMLLRLWRPVDQVSLCRSRMLLALLAACGASDADLDANSDAAPRTPLRDASATVDAGPITEAAVSDDGTGSDAGAPSSDAGSGTDACAARERRGHFQMERLDRGLVSVRTERGNYVGWRMLGHEYLASQPSRVTYRLYRDARLLATVPDSTNFLDDAGDLRSKYTVSAVIDGVECARSSPVTPWPEPYLTIPLEPPPAGTTPSGSYAYNTGTVLRSSGAINDGSPGDVDGDGRYEIIVLWEPSNARDNSQPEHTGPVYLDCYTLDGERLWRMNLGPNIRAGAHYTQFLVYDLDGDGRAEVALKTAPGVRDGTGNFLSKGPAADDDDQRDYRNADGYVLTGPEYLTVFDGATGAELATVPFEVARGEVRAWGDDYGNRVDRFLASVGFVSDLGKGKASSGRPALLMARGYYTRATVSAFTYRDGALTRIWTADSRNPGSEALAGQGAHSMAVADVDGDGAQEILFGAALLGSDGSFGCATGLGHGDALHVGDFIPSRSGLEVFMPHEDKARPSWDLRDARDCSLIHVSPSSGVDNGRGVAADLLADVPGAEFWSAADPSLRSASTGMTVGVKPASINFVIWWDGDDLRELSDGTTITRADGTPLLSCQECMSNNHTKATPTLTADLLGDHREEIVWRTPDSSALRVYTTTHVTQRRLFTLMHDPQYRMQVSSEQTGYNQPPHPSFFLGHGMSPPPEPDIHVR